MKTVLAVFVMLTVSSLSVSLAPAEPLSSWDKQINGPGRFTVLPAFANEAVLDKETGLVWQKAPAADVFTWARAQLHCNVATTGNRLGWRLPTIQELASLVDPSAASPMLPAHHPFENVQTHVQFIFYWSITTSPFFPDGSGAWLMNFDFGPVSFTTTSKLGSGLAWCVRGGQGVGPQQ
jgi:uncharacterized protein DUF1566